MKIAALYDVHGNLPALEAVLAQLEAIQPDIILFGGDVAAGPMPRETVERLIGLRDRARFVRGNADREVSGALEHGAETGGAWGERARWAAERLTDSQRRMLAAWPTAVVEEVDGLGLALFCHGTPRSDEEIVTRVTPEERVREVLAGIEPRLVVCGHTHVQFDRRVAGARIVNAGSVGLPYEGRPGAYWALLGPGVSLMRTEYDLPAAVALIRASGFPEADDYVERYLLAPPSAEQATERFETMATERLSK